MLQPLGYAKRLSPCKSHAREEATHTVMGYQCKPQGLRVVTLND